MKPKFNFFILLITLVLLVNACEEPCYVVTCNDDIAKKSFSKCEVCPEGICPLGFELCNGKCVNIENDRNHCGECNNNCRDGYYCDGGKCVTSCPTVTPTLCFGGCRDLQTDPNHCGECGNKCPEGMICINGQCQCPVGTRLCNGKCVDLSKNREHCGGCNNKCPDGHYCDGGRCIISCPPATPTNCFGGCRDLQTDSNHCGACGNKCPDGTKCVFYVTSKE